MTCIRRQPALEEEDGTGWSLKHLKEMKVAPLLFFHFPPLNYPPPPQPPTYHICPKCDDHRLYLTDYPHYASISYISYSPPNINIIHCSVQTNGPPGGPGVHSCVCHKCLALHQERGGWGRYIVQILCEDLEINNPHHWHTFDIHCYG